MVLPTTSVPDALNHVELVRKLVWIVSAVARVSTLVDETKMANNVNNNRKELRIFLSNIKTKIKQT